MGTKAKYFSLGFVAGILATLGILYGAISYVAYSVNEPCRDLERLSTDQESMSNLWDQLSELIDEQAKLENSDFRLLVVFARTSEDGFGIDWETLGIPVDVATIETRGKAMRLSGFDPALIEEVRVGYGYRYHLVFTIEDEQEARNPDPSQWSYDLSVECRND